MLGSGKGYKYPHEAKEGIVAQEYLGVDKVYYTPTDRGAEAKVQEFLKMVRQREDHKKDAQPE